jgi:hypothetical protein
MTLRIGLDSSLPLPEAGSRANDLRHATQLMDSVRQASMVGPVGVEVLWDACQQLATTIAAVNTSIATIPGFAAAWAVMSGDDVTNLGTAWDATQTAANALLDGVRGALPQDGNGNVLFYSYDAGTRIWTAETMTLDQGMKDGFNALYTAFRATVG